MVELTLSDKIRLVLYELLPSHMVKYTRDSTTKESILVRSFLNRQWFDNKEVLEQILGENNLVSPNPDVTAIKILRWVRANFVWTSDKVTYKKVEYWATIQEILSSLKNGKYRDDCDGGATMIFCLCRAAGIPKHKVFLVAGWVQSGTNWGGHCYVKYLSDKHVVASVFLDWCYDYEQTYIGQGRTAYLDWQGQIIPSNRYISQWFISNDSKSTLYDTKVKI